MFQPFVAEYPRKEYCDLIEVASDDNDDKNDDDDDDDANSKEVEVVEFSTGEALKCLTG